MWKFTLICAVLGAVLAQSGEDSLVVNIKQGPVRGYRHPNTTVFTFYGIPYATAPKGRQRFMPPLPPPQWTDTFEAVNKFIFCIQPGLLSVAQEDCLVANVYVPETEERNLPVMVIVHGGAFQHLFGAIQEPNSMIEYSNMVVVSFNYRLGAHGFLCLGTEEVPGNAGMKDQVALLKWVQENIGYFGGNPNDVTIHGCSAGGMSVDFLSLSPMAEGLFHKIIASSGANTGPLGVQMDPLENAKIYAKALGFDRVDDIDALEEFYKTASYETLVSQLDVIVKRSDSSVLFAACVEADHGSERFLEDAPFNYLRKRNLTRYPMLYGYADLEGLVQMENFDEYKTMMNDNFLDFLPADLQFDTDAQRKEIAEKIKNFYFGNDDVSESNIMGFIDFYTDVIFAYPMLRTVRMHSNFGNNPVYLYEYNFADNNTAFVLNTTERGANHCDQTKALLDENDSDNNFTEEYLQNKKFVTELFSNFVKLGVPVPPGSSLPAWLPANAQRSPHMSIGTTLQIQGPLNQRRAQFWDAIYDQHYKLPVPPKPSDAPQLMISVSLVMMTWLINLLS